MISASTPDESLANQQAVLIGKNRDHAMQVETWLNTWGGMAPLIHLSDAQRRQFWLKDYATAYLERDLADLASLNDLKPFRKFQQIQVLILQTYEGWQRLQGKSGW